MMEKFLECANRWKNTEIKVAVVGQTGVGKSSFVNAIRNIKDPKHRSFAPVSSVREGTREIKTYHHPTHQNLIFYDLPGVGTPTFPRETYLKKIEIEKYDIFIIITAGRFMENDCWLAQEAEKRKKHFYFVRTKIDRDVDSDRRQFGRREHETVFEIREATKESLREQNITPDQVFLIDNFDTDIYDFNNLAIHIKNDLPSWRKEAFVLSMSAFNSEFLEEKKKMLSSRIAWIAAGSSLAATFPIPGTGYAADIAIIRGETALYREQLEIDDDSLTVISKKVGIPMADLIKEDKVTSAKILKEPSAFANEIGFSAARWIVDFIPLINSVSGLMAWKYCADALDNILSICIAEAEFRDKAVRAHIRRQREKDIGDNRQ